VWDLRFSQKWCWRFQWRCVVETVIPTLQRITCLHLQGQAVQEEQLCEKRGGVTQVPAMRVANSHRGWLTNTFGSGSWLGRLRCRMTLPELILHFNLHSQPPNQCNQHLPLLHHNLWPHTNLFTNVYMTHPISCVAKLVRLLFPEHEGTKILHNVGATCPVTKRHVPEDFTFQDYTYLSNWRLEI
jgi:hypothetical protein